MDEPRYAAPSARDRGQLQFGSPPGRIGSGLVEL